MGTVPMVTVCVSLSGRLGLSVPLGLLVADLLLSASEAGLENECGAQYSHSLEERCCIKMHRILTSGNDRIFSVSLPFCLKGILLSQPR